MMDFFAAALARFEEMEAELNALDAKAGDGDHGATMVKGLRAAAEADDPAAAFRKAAGGASGALFAEVVAALVRASEGALIGEALGDAAKRIEMLGQAKPGDKTMLDALFPAASAQNLRSAAEVANAGRASTKEMAAKRGRARHVEGKGVGHVDAGATSVAVLLDAFAEFNGA